MLQVTVSMLQVTVSMLQVTVSMLQVAAAMAQPTKRPATKNVCKTRGCNYCFQLLMMGGVSPETC